MVKLNDKPTMIQIIPISYIKELYSNCFDLLKTKYKELIGISLILFITSLTNAIPIVGTVIAPIFSSICNIGLLFIVRDWTKQKDTNFSGFLNYATNIETIKEILPLIVINIFISVLFFIFQKNPGVMALLVLLSIPLFFVLPLMLFKQMKLKMALTESLNGVLSNIPFLFIFIITIIGLVTISTLLLLLPLIFFTFPLILPSYYIIYYQIFTPKPPKYEPLI